MSVNNNKITLNAKSIIVLTVAALVAMGGIGGAAAGIGSLDGLQMVAASEEEPGETAVSLEPSSVTVNPGDTATYDVVVEDADGGVGAYNFTVSIADTSVASITDAEALGNTSELTRKVSIANDGSSVEVAAALGNTSDTGSVTIGTVTVSAKGAGTSDIGLVVNVLGNERGNGYPVTEAADASITVETPEPPEPEPEPADFQVDNLQAPSSATQGDLIDVSAEIENAGEAEGTQTVGFRIGASSDDPLGSGDELVTQQVTLDSGETETVTFSDIDTSSLSPGEYTHGIFTENDSETATITIEERSGTTVSLDPSSATINPGDTTTYDVVVESVDGGVGAYHFTVTIADTTGASITDAEALANPSDLTTDVSVANDGSSVEVAAAMANTTDTGSVTIGSVTVEGVAPGNSDVGLIVDALGTEAGDGYEVTDTSGASITVEAPEPDPEPEPETPTADAGEDQTVSEGSTVTLDASGSTDSDDDSLAYTWSQTDGPDVAPSDANTASPSFTAPEVDEQSTLTLEVTVSDGEGGTDTDEVTVTVRPIETEGPFFEVTALDVPDRAAQGESVEVAGEVTNTGDAEGTQTVEIRIDVDNDGTPETMRSRSITLSAGENFSMTETRTIPLDLEPGTYTGGLFTEDSSQTDTIEIVAAQPKETFTRDEISQAKYGYDFDELSDETSREVEELYLRQPFADGAQPEDVKTRDEIAQERHDRNFDELSRETTIEIQSDFDAQFGDTGDGAAYTRDEISQAKYGYDFDELSTETSGQVEELYNRQPFADEAGPSEVRTREEIANEKYGIDLGELSRETRLEIERTYHQQFAESTEDSDQAPA